MHKVKIYSLPGLIHLGTMRVRNTAPAYIAKRMQAKLIASGTDSGTLEEKNSGRQLMYCVMDSGEKSEPTTK